MRAARQICLPKGESLRRPHEGDRAERSAATPPARGGAGRRPRLDGQDGCPCRHERPHLLARRLRDARARSRRLARLLRRDRGDHPPVGATDRGDDLLPERHPPRGRAGRQRVPRDAGRGGRRRLARLSQDRLSGAAGIDRLRATDLLASHRDDPRRAEASAPSFSRCPAERGADVLEQGDGRARLFAGLSVPARRHPDDLGGRSVLRPWDGARRRERAGPRRAGGRPQRSSLPGRPGLRRAPDDGPARRVRLSGHPCAGSSSSPS